MKWTLFLAVALALSADLCAQSKPDEIRLLTASGHPMQYYASLPKGWTADRKWPVVLIFEAAEKEYKINLERFIAARGEMPFILVAPIHTNNGNQGRRDPKLFPYSTETWDYIDKVGDCKFNEDGISHVVADCKKMFSTEDRFYATGFEAGAHMLWTLVFHHPEYLKAAAPIAGNYRGRCVDVTNISSDPLKSTIPIKAIVGEQDEAFGRSSTLYNQWLEAKDLALKNGYKDVTEMIVKGKGHAPMPGEVLEYFFKLSR